MDLPNFLWLRRGGGRHFRAPAGLLLCAALAGCGAATSLVPGGGLAKAALDAGGAAAPGGAPLVSGDLNIVQHPGSGPLVAAARIEGDLSVSQAGEGEGAPATEAERAERARRQEIEVLRRLLEEREDGGDADGG